MKSLWILFGCVALTAAAQARDSGPTTVRVPGLTLRHYHLWPEQLHQYAGIYHLSNGAVLELRQAGSHLYAQIGDRPEKEIVPIGPDSFGALDRSLSLHLHVGESGDVYGHMSYIN